jgi:hypothetical protein
MFYEQSCEYITWPRYKHACRRAFAWGMLLGLVGVVALASYWFLFRPPGVKAFKQQNVLGPVIPLPANDRDLLEPHTITTGLDGLDYYQRRHFYHNDDKVVRYANAVLVVPVLLILGGGVLAVIVLTLASLGSLRFRQTAAQARAADRMN